MPNVLGNYNETFFAQEALIQLEKALGLAARVYRGYDPTPRANGDTIQLRRPSTFSAQNAPSSAQDAATESVSIVVDKWKEVKFSLTDKELSLNSAKLIEDHIRPAAYALADAVDTDLAALYKKVPWVSALSATPVLSDITAAQEVMFGNNVPMNDGMLHAMVGGKLQRHLQNALSASGMQPNQQDGAIRRGALGELYGAQFFANQNTPKHTSGVAADATGTVDGVNAVGATSMLISGVTAGITVKVGDTFSIAGDTQRYAITADATDADGSAFNVAFYPALKKATAGSEVVTITLGGASKDQNLMFHRNAFALAMAPLSDIGGQLGARIATVSDPTSNLTLRSRLFYDGNNSKVYVALDVLYGVQVLDPNLAVRMTEA